jgi:hypothetical protein
VKARLCLGRVSACGQGKGSAFLWDVDPTFFPYPEVKARITREIHKEES